MVRRLCGLESLERRTMLTANVVADFGGIYPENSVTVASGETFFIANDGKHGDQLWISDGTVAGTHMVKIIADGGIGLPTLVPFGNGVAMLGGIGLWTSDGTAAGTVEVAPEPSNSVVIESSLESINGHLTFITTPVVTVSNSATIWSSDGTTGNLNAIEQLSNVTVQSNLATYIYAPAVIGNRVIYTNIFGTQPDTVQLWSTDGTMAGTFRIDADAAVGQMGPVGDYLFWQYNVGLFSTDGTTAGTQLISDVVPSSYNTYGENSIDPEELDSYAGVQSIADGRFFFAVPGSSGSQDDTSTQVWESDGTAAGTHEAFTVSGVFSEVAASANGVVLFAYNISHFDDSDGTPDVSSTYTLYNFDPDSGQLSAFYQFNDPGVVKNVIEVDGSVYFYYWDGATQNTTQSYSFNDMPNFQLWRTDGTLTGTSHLQTYSYWPELTPVGEDVLVSDAPNESAGTQIIEPAAPTAVQGMTQNAVSLVGGVLRVFGTSGDDNIRIYQLDTDPSRLVIDLNGVKHSFEMDLISEIKVYGEDGDDSIAVVESHGKLGIRTYVDGGAGNDTIYTGGGRDTIYGGAGNDMINSGNNDDCVDGGDGNDTIIGGNGNDTINGGDGADYIEGNKGDNVLTGGDDDSADTIIGTGGEDVLFGQAAIDVFFNGSNQSDPLDTILS